MKRKPRLFNSNEPIRQKGLTLIEIMIALLLGAFLIGGIIQIFVNTRQTYKMEDALSRLQENGRFAMEFIGRDIRMADYRFCPSKPRMANAIAGTDGNNALNPDNPDTITVSWSTRPCADVLNTSNQSAVISMGTLDRIEGVENLQILYGIDSDGNRVPDFYSPVTAALNMAQVSSVRVSLLLSTIENNITSTPLAYFFNNEQTPGPDRRLRRVFTTTFALRNRIP
jgi:type IV pilus assembly protein PilW